MNNRWTFQEESQLIKSVATGKTYKELSGGFNRSENALELRVKKIVYENISNNKPADKIAQLLNMPKDKVMQYFYSYKDHLERQSGGNNSASANNISANANNILSDNNQSKLNMLNNRVNTNNQVNIDNNKSMVGGNNMSAGNNNIIGGNKLSKLEYQNRKMKLLLENYALKHKITKLMKTNNNAHIYDAAIKAIVNN
jgi:hypothetical protein